METLIIAKPRLIPQKIAKKLFLILAFIFVFDFFLFPAPVLASEYYTDQPAEAVMAMETASFEIVNSLPANIGLDTARTKNVFITAYNSEVAQCDDDPCTTANGYNLCEHGIEDSIAANFLPFGAKVRIPELFGNKVFIVRDRMNSRYDSRVDVWMVNKTDAIQFGVKFAKIEILEP